VTAGPKFKGYIHQIFLKEKESDFQVQRLILFCDTYTYLLSYNVLLQKVLQERKNAIIFLLCLKAALFL